VTALQREAAVFELTVAGALGPVLRSAVGSHLAGGSHMYTVVRMGLPPGTDLVDLVLRLHACGLDVVDISAAASVPARSPDSP